MKQSVFIDSDSFFWPSNISDEYMRKQRNGVGFAKEDQPFRTLFEQYYLGFRSSMYICEEGLDPKRGKELLESWCKTSITMARDYALVHLNTEASLPVDFMWITKQKIVAETKSQYPDVEKIQLLLSMKPRISARVKDEKTIVFPALVRTVLNHCNLVLINHAFDVLDNKLESIDRRHISRFILPYLLFCHDDFSVKNLPIVGGYSSQAISIALSFTNLQVMYIFAHEYAHILLKHFDNIPSIQSKEILENEADAFALDTIIKYIDKDDSYTKNDVFTAIRWLFKYQRLEESVGILMRGENLKNFNSEYENRRSIFQADLIKKCNISETSFLDMVGFASIVELQEVLCEYGEELIDTVIQAFNESNSEGGIEPWWEKIAKK